MAIRHTTLLSAALGAAFMLSSAAQACTLDGWTAGGIGSIQGAPVAGGPSEAVQVRRYSGLCGMRATGTGNFVQNDSPAADQIFRARFYVFSSVSSGTATVYQAGNGGNANVVAVTMSSSQISVTPAGGSAMNFPITAGRWYSVEVAMNATGTATTGDDPITANTVIARVGGGGSDAVSPLTSSITNGSSIDFARLGCVSGCGANNVDFEEYESTRSAGTAVGRLCRGDANGDGNRNSGDLIAVRNDFTPPNNRASGQPDANEDGNVNSGDLITIRNIFTAVGTACP